ncbi:MAG: hypothetical protein NTW87_03380 [Planctomycetota bacterium]|nr:hypothetical protein [Planctomycetota bacterium]
MVLLEVSHSLCQDAAWMVLFVRGAWTAQALSFDLQSRQHVGCPASRQ